MILNNWIHHLNTQHSEKLDVEKNDKLENNVDNIEDFNHVDGVAKVGPGKRPAKIAKRRQSEPQPICNINVKQVSSMTRKAKSTSVAKETKSK